jgi:hypothetical protein
MHCGGGKLYNLFTNPTKEFLCLFAIYYKEVKHCGVTPTTKPTRRDTLQE